MADVYPVKVLRTLGDTDALAEFYVGDTVPVDAGGTGADNAAGARTNLGAVEEAPADGTLYGRKDNAWESVAATMGNVNGPASSTDNAIARFDGVTGKLIQDSAIFIDDVGNMTLAGTIDGRDVSADGSVLDGHVADATIHFTEASIDHTAITNIGTNTHAQIDTHIADTTIHFTEASIDHTAITNIGTNSHAAIDLHIADGTIHFTEGSIDHTAITNIGTNSHAVIDSHIADATIHFTEASIDHTAISNIGVNSHANIDSHIADATIHFTEASIDHTAILNVGANTHAQIDTHIADTSIHFTEASIDHTAIQNVGTNTHAQIDSHISDATIHFTEASIDHTAITNVGTNTHAQIDTHIADTDIHFSDAPADGNDYVRNNNAWALLSVAGDVVGPAGATDNAIARYDGITGKLIQDSLVLIDDLGNISGAGTYNGIDISTTVPQTRTLTAGAGLTGGGDLSADRTFDVGDGAGITVNADDIEVNVTNSIEIATDNLQLVNDEASPGNYESYGTTAAGVKGWQPRLFGPEYYEFEDLVESSTTSITYIAATLFTTVSLPAGDYYVSWSADVGSEKNKATNFRLQINNTTTLSEQGAKIEGSWLTPGIAYYNFAGSAHLTLSGVQAFEFDFAGGASTYMKNVRLQLWRVN